MRKRAWWACATLVVGAAGCAQHRTSARQGDDVAPAPTAAPAPGVGSADSVAVGYGMQSRRTITGAVGTVDGRTGERDGAQRTEELLRRVPGVTVMRLTGGSYSVRVRGGGAKLTSGGSSSVGEPLFVLDGVPLPIGPGALDNLPPGDVDRIDVLKGADAAIYGSQAANGVILVRTRRWTP